MPLPSTPPTRSIEDVSYPESDGKPMGETGFHVEAILTLHAALQDHFAGRDDVYIASDMFLYYEQGNPRANKSPDVMVILGVPNHKRRTFKTWVEGAVPTVIFEISSNETYKEDLNSKREVYARLGVAEYFLFDPLGDCLDSTLMGFRLAGSSYVPLLFEADGGLTSERLGVRLLPSGDLLRLLNSRTGNLILTGTEKTSRLQAETARLQAEIAEKERERERADGLAAEVDRLQALLDQRGKSG